MGVENFSRYRLLAICSTLHALNHSYSNILPPVIPIIIAEFNLTYSFAGFLMTAFYLAYAFFQLPAGYFADRVSWSSLLFPGAIISAVGIAFMTIGKNSFGFLASMLVSGIGGGIYHPVGLSLIGNVFRKEERGRALGIHGIAASVGFFLTPLVLGFLFDYGWRLSFQIFASFGLLIAGISWVLSFKKTGILIHQNIEEKMDNGLKIDSQKMRINKYAIYATVTRSIFAFCNIGVTAFLPAFLKSVYGLSDQTASFIFSFMFAAGLISSFIGGYFSDKFGRESVLLVVLSIMSVGTFALWLQTPIFLLIIAIFAFGAASNAFVPVADALLADLLPEFTRGRGFGVFYTVSFLAQAISPTISGFLTDRFGFNVVYLIMAIGMTLGIPFVILCRSRLEAHS